VALGERALRQPSGPSGPRVRRLSRRRAGRRGRRRDLVEIFMRVASANMPQFAIRRDVGRPRIRRTRTPGGNLRPLRRECRRNGRIGWDWVVLEDALSSAPAVACPRSSRRDVDASDRTTPSAAGAAGRSVARWDTLARGKQNAASLSCQVGHSRSRSTWSDWCRDIACRLRRRRSARAPRPWRPARANAAPCRIFVRAPHRDRRRSYPARDGCLRKRRRPALHGPRRRDSGPSALCADRSAKKRS